MRDDMTVTSVTGADGLTYEYDDATYTLTVGGTGNMTSLNSGKVGGYDFSGAIKVIIGN